ncbi:MAG: hypothetical protein QE272_01450, partial [Nevskia sp.]|nr:hypothetical protein [Nevskia sp.]
MACWLQASGRRSEQGLCRFRVIAQATRRAADYSFQASVIVDFCLARPIAIHGDFGGVAGVMMPTTVEISADRWRAMFAFHQHHSGDRTTDPELHLSITKKASPALRTKPDGAAFVP